MWHMMESIETQSGLIQAPQMECIRRKNHILFHSAFDEKDSAIAISI
jgi:hypothetical protein